MSAAWTGRCVLDAAVLDSERRGRSSPTEPLAAGRLAL